MLEAGTILQDRYRILRPLGQGGMGAVYQATDMRLRSTVALKETLVEGDAFRKAFEREAHLLASLRHAALPVVSDHFNEGEGQFLVMQYIPGEDLSKLCEANGGPFPVSVVLRWADQLLDALDYLHTRSPTVLHRDIKPQNMKLTERGELILLDFGLAKGTASSQGKSQLSAGSSVVGFTLAYAPLEQIEGSGTEPRSDIYSAAATLYHLATYVKPPDAISRAMALVSGRRDPLRLASVVNPLIPPEISALLDASMANSPEDRPSSAADLRRAFRDARKTSGLPGADSGDTTFFAKSPHALQKPESSPKPSDVTRRPPVDPQYSPRTMFQPPSSFGEALPDSQTNVRASAPLPSDWQPPAPPRTEFHTAAVPPAAPVLPTRTAGFPVVSLTEAGREAGRDSCSVEIFDEGLGGTAILEMVSIPGGSFRMGSAESTDGKESKESPAHDVKLRAFFIGRLPITQEQWRAVAAMPQVRLPLDLDPSHFKGASRPVEKVSWGDCQEFCQRLSRHTGRRYRLPTEAEWEYACRAGTATPFHFGPTITTEFVNYDGSFPFGSAPKGAYRKETTPPGGAVSANGFGLVDMHGNVWEWCEDVWHDGYHGAPADGGSWTTGGDVAQRVLRGGSWYGRADYCRSAARVGLAADGRNARSGFRVVMTTN